MVQFKNDDATTLDKVYQYLENDNDSSKYMLMVPATGSTTSTVTIGVVADQTTGITSSQSKIGDTYISSDVTFVWVSGDGDNLRASTSGKSSIAASGPKYHLVIEPEDSNDPSSRKLVTVVFVESASATSEDEIFVSDVLGTVEFKNADGRTVKGTRVEFYAYGETEPDTMIVSGSVSKYNFYTTTADGEGYKLNSAMDSKEKDQVTAMYNGYATVDSTEYDFNDAVIIDTTDSGLDDVDALENAVNDGEDDIYVAFAYSGSDKDVETVYVYDTQSTDTEVVSVFINGTKADVGTSASGLKAVEVAKGGTLTLTVNLSSDDAKWDAWYDDDGTTYASFSNGVSTASANAETTGNIQIKVTAENGDVSWYYVSFATPADPAE